MTKTKTPSIVSQIVERLYSDGPMKVADMCTTIQYPYKSVYTKALELQKLGLADKDDDGVWSLKEGVTPSTLETGKLVETQDEEESGEGSESTRKVPPIARSTGKPLDQTEMFIQELKNIGCSPKEAIPTVTSIFFSGDIEDLHWLEKVLKRDAAGFVTAHQRRLIISWWSNTRGLPYDEEEFFPDFDAEGQPKKAVSKGEKPEARPEKRLDPGMGWKIEKDRDGDWIATPGGPMSYQEAIDAARERHLIAAYTRGKTEPDDEANDSGEEAGVPRKGGKRQESLMEYMFKKMIDTTLDSGKGKASEDSDTVRRLTERIEEMEKARQEERFERMEGMVAQALSRDPWEEYDRINQMKERLGVGSPVVTDQSPAVQLIKDSTERADKNINRLVGIIERAALRSDEFAPEKTRSPQDREQKADQLLGEVESRERSRGLRREVFGR